FTDRMPDDPAMREYIQNLGSINCRLAEYAEIVLEIQAGNPVIWKGENLFREIMDECVSDCFINV
ncbi:MAG: bifunctional adenosylcobinamide kinase/adenosylcobinamide-phosphate guanylyltransferase, partial [Oscillospiraceae bacterium]|nr:bifunctional adenosylcobinamide kinase/adenosylcobinamide-phosphate guanylyltransferase [Oscillospiraceae bacterium]